MPTLPALETHKERAMVGEPAQRATAVAGKPGARALQEAARWGKGRRAGGSAEAGRDAKSAYVGRGFPYRFEGEETD